MCLSFYTQTMKKRWRYLPERSAGHFLKKGVVKKLFWQEAVSRFFFLFTLKCSNFTVFISRRLPCIAENIQSGQKNVDFAGLVTVLVYVKKLCSLRFIWDVLCTSQRKHNIYSTIKKMHHICDRPPAKPVRN